MGIFEHAALGFCWWDVPGLLVLIAVTVAFLVKRHKLKEEKEELKKQLSN